MGDLTKKELEEIIKELRAKLKEFKTLEQSSKATAEELSQLGISVVKGSDGKYSLVELKFDLEKNVAVVGKVTALDTHDFSIATYKANQFLAEKILRKARGDKYVG